MVTAAYNVQYLCLRLSMCIFIYTVFPIFPLTFKELLYCGGEFLYYYIARLILFYKGTIAQF